MSIICGELQLDVDDHEAIINPRVIFKVLSKSTESYDQGKNFDLYRHLDSIREYILVSQEEPHIERFTRQEDGSWLLSVYKGMETELELLGVTGVRPFAEV